MNSSKQKYQKPSERLARFILGIFGWFKYVAGSPNAAMPRGQAVQHHGRELSPGNAIHFSSILLVEDDPNIARDFIAIIKKYYVCGSIMIFVAHAYDAAVTFFENEDVNLVIMDADLDDEDGDGASLVQQFLGQKPNLVILANSSSKISNHKLTGFGAMEILGKNPERLKKWFLQHDPAGSGC